MLDDILDDRSFERMSYNLKKIKNLKLLHRIKE